MIKLKYILFSLTLTILFSFSIPKTEGEIVWLTNLEEAQKISKKTKKPILANFTGSDWCGWCHKLSAEVFNTPEFKVWSDKNVVLLELDYPKRKEQTDAIKQQNAGLQQAFQVQGFPTIWVFNLDVDKVTKKYNITQIAKSGYVKGGSKAFTDGIDTMLAQHKEQSKIKK
ncbi:thioredoxin fold domain-containing protein [Flavobacterium sp.]|uniref:thioredoxin family protein n=1 Tax=Flavobacterium sp. TaxID=239 RepID=UPI00286E5C21|nr:thioredoxin fold domain-containing protein [Flavobacterium sp.]